MHWIALVARSCKSKRQHLKLTSRLVAVATSCLKPKRTRCKIAILKIEIIAGDLSMSITLVGKSFLQQLGHGYQSSGSLLRPWIMVYMPNRWKSSTVSATFPVVELSITTYIFCLRDPNPSRCLLVNFPINLS